MNNGTLQKRATLRLADFDEKPAADIIARILSEFGYPDLDTLKKQGMYIGVMLQTPKNASDVKLKINQHIPLCVFFDNQEMIKNYAHQIIIT
jgi:hypothetical protein